MSFLLFVNNLHTAFNTYFTLPYHHLMACTSLICADVPLTNYSLSH